MESSKGRWTVIIIVVAVFMALAVLRVTWERRPKAPPPEEQGGPYAFLVLNSSGGLRTIDFTPGFPGKPSQGKPSPTPADLQAATASPPTFSDQRQLLGTVARIHIWGDTDEVNQVRANLAFDRIADIGRQMNFYDENSDLVRLNATAGGPGIVVTPDMMTVLERALLVAELSDGAFDPTVGPLVRLWRSYLTRYAVPPPESIRQARDLVGYKNVILDKAAMTVRLTKPGMQLDLGGIAKGYASDEAAKVLQQEGVQAATVEIGGVSCFGRKPNGDVFHILIQNPYQLNGPPLGLVEGTDMAAVTSGNYFQTWTVGDQVYTHFIDPHTGQSIIGLSSCTVTGPDAMTADALATAVCVLNVKEGMVLFQKINAWAQKEGIGKKK